MKRVLIIAYYFPPVGGSGVLRPTKFVKYLHEHGWQPYVVCASRTYLGETETRDESLLADIPEDVAVWRVPTPTPRPVNRLARLIGWRAAAQNGIPAGTSRAEAADGSARANRLTPWKRSLRRLLLAPLYLIQDPPVDQAFYWSLRVVVLACRIIKREHIDVVMTTVPPFSPLITGALIKRLTGVPWVADFRDPWIDDPLVYDPTPRRRQFDTRLERALLRRTDALISVTAPLVRQLSDKLGPQVPKRGLAVIPNGWDQADAHEFAIATGEAKPSLTNGKISITYTGSSYLGGPALVLDALQSPDLDRALVERLAFRFVGYMHPDDAKRIDRSALCGNFRLDARRIPHPDALRLMRSSDVLLLMGHHPNFCPGKTFEYMLAQRPVLAVAEGAVADIVEECGIGCAVHPHRPSELVAALRMIATDYDGFVAKYYHPNQDAIRQYDRRVLTGRLARVLDSVSDS